MKRLINWFFCHVVGGHNFIDENGRRAGELPRMARWRCEHCGYETEDWVW